MIAWTSGFALTFAPSAVGFATMPSCTVTLTSAPDSTVDMATGVAESAVAANSTVPVSPMDAGKSTLRLASCARTPSSVGSKRAAYWLASPLFSTSA